MKYAYVTLTTVEHYIYCIKRNAQRLQYLKSKYPLIVMLTDNLKENPNIHILEEEPNIIIHFIPQLNFLEKGIQPEKNNYITEYYLQDMLHKFQMLSLTEYDKLFFLDADILLIGNIDKIFDLNYDFGQNDFIFLANKDKTKNAFKYYEPLGTLFYCKPNIETYNFLMELFQKPETYYEDDIEVYKKYFYINRIVDDYPRWIFDFFHIAGYLKIWQIKTGFINWFFYTCSSEDFNNFFETHQNDLSELFCFFADFEELNKIIEIELGITTQEGQNF